VRALVRGRSHSLPAGVETVRGDVLDPASLPAALAGARAIVTTATGFSDWASPNPAVDSEGNRNLIDAAATAGVSRFMFTSALAAEGAQSVTPFWMKKLTEDHLETSGVPFVALRFGTLIGGTHDFWARDLARGRLTSMRRRRASRCGLRCRCPWRPRDHGDPVGGEHLRELPRSSDPLVRCPPRSDYGDGARVVPVQLAAVEEERRRARDHAEIGGVALAIEHGHELRPGVRRGEVNHLSGTLDAFVERGKASV
jgi:hypothetical protein